MERKIDQLRRDSEDISHSLDEFLKKRAEVADAQRQALIEYNLELQNIGEVTEAPEPIPLSSIYSREGNVDHNLMRHINHKGDDPTSDEDYSILETSNNPNKSLTQNKKPPNPRRKELRPLTRSETPSPEEKSHIRVQIFKFLESTRDEESEQVTKVQEAKGDPQEFPLFLQLCELQRRNYDTLMEYITAYQLEPFNRAFANDPDYVNLLHKFQQREQRVQDGKDASKKKKKKPKKKVTAA